MSHWIKKTEVCDDNNKTTKTSLTMKTQTD